MSPPRAGPSKRLSSEFKALLEDRPFSSQCNLGGLTTLALIAFDLQCLSLA